MLLAQTNRGSIVGTVTDKTGAVVAGATVTITNVGTNSTVKTATSGSGTYSALDLEPVTYRIEVQAPGFTKAEAQSVKVNTGNTATVNFALVPAGSKVEVNVEASAQVINTESGTIGQTIDQKLLENAPLVNRSVLDLAMTVPNVSGDAGSEEPGVGASGIAPGFNMNVNGGRAGSTMMMTDGVNNTGVGVARAVVSFTPETVQEFSVQTNAYSAAYGRVGGGVINVTTKAGTNAYHGAAIWYTRNPYFNAKQYTLGVPSNATARHNQFSGSIGGPVFLPKIYDGHNKSFFFFAAEPRRSSDHTQTYGFMPTDAMRHGDFSNAVNAGGIAVPADIAAQFPSISTSALTLYNNFTLLQNGLLAKGTLVNGAYPVFNNNIIPAEYLDPLSQKLLQYIPVGGKAFLDPDGKIANIMNQRYVHRSETRYTLRLDHQLTRNNQLMFRMTATPVFGEQGYLEGTNNDVSGGVGQYSQGKQFMVADTYTISPRVVNDLRINYTRGNFSSTFPKKWDVNTGRNFSTELGLPSLTHGGLPLIEEGLSKYVNIGNGGSTQGTSVEERYNISDYLYVTHGNMSISMGVDLSHELLNTLNTNTAAGADFTFSTKQTSSNGGEKGAEGGLNFASFLLGVPSGVDFKKALLPYYYRWNSMAAFIQDDWKVRPNLTLNLGLRYSLQLPRTEKYNHQGSFRPELAKSYALATPVNLVDGTVINSILLPPFYLASSGSKYIWNINRFDFEPRFGFAWSPKLFGLSGQRLVIRGGYGLSHLPFNGQNRQPFPDFGAPSGTYNSWNNGDPAGTKMCGTGACAVRLSSNPPVRQFAGWSDVLSGLQADPYLGALGLGTKAFAVVPNFKNPYSQSWNLSVSYQLDSKDVLEVAYVGNKGTHLFMPTENQNAPSTAYLSAMEYAGKDYSSDATSVTFAADGKARSIKTFALGSKYGAYTNLYTRWDPSASSIRHAGYINWQRRETKGLTLSANYTFGKSIDNASDGDPEGSTLVTATSITGGAASFGYPSRMDRSVSTFDVRHSISVLADYQLPFGRGGQLLRGASPLVNAIVGDWAVSAMARRFSGFPFMPMFKDTNGLGDSSSSSWYSVRPDLVSGVPLKNPAWKSSCPTSADLCEPYLNPSAFMRPAYGTFGNSPRTIDAVRGPSQNNFDLSLRKNFSLRDGKVGIQFRADLLNAFNHPNFGIGTNYKTSGTQSLFSGTPSYSNTIDAGTYDNWAKSYTGGTTPALSKTAEGKANIAKINSWLAANQDASKKFLSPDFYRVALPNGFVHMKTNSFDILQGIDQYRMWQLRKSYDSNFGGLKVIGSPRYVQFGLKVTF